MHFELSDRPFLACGRGVVYHVEKLYCPAWFPGSASMHECRPLCHRLQDQGGFNSTRLAIYKEDWLRCGSWSQKPQDDESIQIDKCFLKGFL